MHIKVFEGILCLEELLVKSVGTYGFIGFSHRPSNGLLITCNITLFFEQIIWNLSNVHESIKVAINREYY